jgi:hypothetical protein
LVDKVVLSLDRAAQEATEAQILSTEPFRRAAKWLRRPTKPLHRSTEVLLRQILPLRRATEHRRRRNETAVHLL